MSGALKSNTTLTGLDVSGGHKMNNTNSIQQQSFLFSILIKSTDNRMGETGATSLVDALKSNTTLTELNLSSENHETIHKWHPQTIISSSFSSNQQGTRLETKE